MPLDVEILADQIRRAFWGESWHGPSVREVLAGISAEDAAAHPIAGAHSIWEIVLHLIGGYILVLRRVRGEDDLASAIVLTEHERALKHYHRVA